jgi:hypothetical protein
MNNDGSELVGGQLPSGQGQALQLDSSGNLKTSGSITASNPSVSTNGSTTPTSSTAIGGSDGTNLQQALVESATHPNIRMAVYNGANELAIDASGKAPVKAASGDFADGAITTIGTEADAAASSDTGTFTLIALFKRALQKLASIVSSVANIPELGQTTKSGSVPVTLASDQGAITVTDTTGSAVALSSPPSATTAATDTSFTFSQKVNHFLIQNNTAAVVNVALDATASPGSVSIAAGATWRDDIPVTAIHLYTAATQNVNGSSAANIVLLGWL